MGNNVATTATGTQQIGGTGIPVGRVNNVQRNWENQLVGSGALDFNMNQKDQLRFRYVHNELDASWSGNALTALQTPRSQRSLMANLSHYHIFGNATTNELRLGYNRIDAQQDMMGFNGSNVAIGGGTNLNLGPQFSPAGIVNTYHVADNIGFRAGTHELKFGFDGRRSLGFRNNFSQFAGNYAFSSLERFLLNLPPDVAAQRTFGNDRVDLGHWSFFGFAHDMWRAGQKFTRDLAVRYQYSENSECVSQPGAECTRKRTRRDRVQ